MLQVHSHLLGSLTMVVIDRAQTNRFNWASNKRAISHRTLYFPPPTRGDSSSFRCHHPINSLTQWCLWWWRRGYRSRGNLPDFTWGRLGWSSAIPQNEGQDPTTNPNRNFYHQVRKIKTPAVAHHFVLKKQQFKMESIKEALFLTLTYGSTERSGVVLLTALWR